MHEDRRLFRRILGLGLLASLALGLITGSTYDGAQAAAPSTVLPSQNPSESIVLRVYFRNQAERDRLATELGAEEASTRQGYLTVWSDLRTYRSLLSRGD